MCACMRMCARACVHVIQFSELGSQPGYDHGRRSVGDGGDASPHFSAWGDSIGIVPPLFSSEKLRGI